ncbi:hypothetical protein [Sorangium sp. So ce1335]|uniref:hypothetical protein n=1 Tax=Sorangium sp. So ce1335 TaxID=3133335 RepID=UPI003F61A210
MSLSSCIDGGSPRTRERPTLRILPEVTCSSESPRRVYVLLELRQPDLGEAPLRPVVIYLRADGATVGMLPGPTFCEAPSDGAGAAGGGGGAAGDAAGDGGAAGDAAGDGGAADGAGGGGGSGPGDEGVGAGEANLVIPSAALLVNDAAGTRDFAFLLELPDGKDLVSIYATAYSHEGKPGDCEGFNLRPIAVGRQEIERTCGRDGADDGEQGGGGEGGSQGSAGGEGGAGAGGGGEGGAGGGEGGAGGGEGGAGGGEGGAGGGEGGAGGGEDGGGGGDGEGGDGQAGGDGN